MVTTPQTPFRQCGSTDLASFTKAISRTYQGSGISGMGRDANLIFSTLQQAGLDRLGAAMAWHETKNGTWPGPIPFNYHNPWAMVDGTGYHHWANYPTYHDAAAAWAKILLDPKGPYSRDITLHDFILTYAPPSDGNDVQTYLATICREIDALPLVSPAPPPGPPPPPPPPPQPDAGQRIADCAIAQLGKPYVWGTHGPDTFDCSGLVSYCASVAAGIQVSPDSHAQYQAGVSVNRGDLQAGDVLCYDTEGGSEVRLGNRCSHVGIYVTRGEMVNALNPSSGVIKSNPFDAYFAPLFLGARRLTPTPAPTPPPTPAPLPPIYKFVGTANHQPRSLGPQQIQFLVHHVTDDLNLSDVISWFQNPNSRASATFVIDRDGKIYQFMSTLVAPWTNGEINRPRHDIPALNKALATGHNFNEFCVTIEYVGKPNLQFTDQQYTAGIAIARYVIGMYYVPPHRYGQLRHADVDSVNRPYCPGPNFDLARIITATGGDPQRLL